MQPAFWEPVTYQVGFPGGSVVKNPPAEQGTQVRFLDQEEESATHSNILA